MSTGSPRLQGGWAWSGLSGTEQRYGRLPEQALRWDEGRGARGLGARGPQLTNCLRASNRLVMNFFVRMVTAASLMASTRCFLAFGFSRRRKTCLALPDLTPPPF